MLPRKEHSMKKAIIIGAGPAGLTAAYQLLKETDIIPVILEESEYIGGISRTAEYKGNRIDLGGHRFFSKNEQVTRLWETLMPLQGAPAIDDYILKREIPLAPFGPDPEKTDQVSLIRQRVSRIFFLRKFFDYPITMKPETFINMGFIRTMQAGFGYLFSLFIKRKEQSLEDFYINRFGKPLYRMFFEDYTTKLWGIHPSKIAPDWGAQRVKELSLGKIFSEFFKKLFNKNHKTTQTSLIEQFMYPKKGPGQLWEKMAQEIQSMGGEIHFNHSVCKIQLEDHKVTQVVATTKDGESTFEADYIFSSMPIKDLANALSDIPKSIHEIATNLPYRDYITVGVLANKLKLVNKTKIKTIQDIVPDCWIYIQERDVKIGRLQIFNNWSPYMVADFKNKVWIGLEYFCDEGDELWSMSDSKFIQFAQDELVKIGIIDSNDILDATRIRVKKAYPAYFGSYSDMPKVESYLNSIENLFCIGRNGQHRYNNMDHSMLTAIEAVQLIKNNQSDKSIVWKVNTESDYHEIQDPDSTQQSFNQ